MRKRLIGKAFAIAMSGAMVLTATPVTANIFHVAHIVKAANEQSDEYVYCYAGLTWNEYWASEGVYAAGNVSALRSPRICPAIDAPDSFPSRPSSRLLFS